ncbi:GxxExxY protein [Pedobacter aquatilis]|uniref:GxxExxY protein n=1 Tax=Pedobacter aquatilis TaxID=351343 RepID=UPI0025B60B09|nr:GxxExxY protein [Pedobacter aquatilis]MDN3588749.1 GxxExxY protein [Pedobacter aquatilis]
MLESIYHKCLIRELQLQNINFINEQPIVVEYKDLLMDTIIRADLLIENCLILELKSVEKILPIHQAQILIYMKLLNAPCGLLINSTV